MSITPETVRSDREALRARWYAEGYFGQETMGQQFLRAAAELPDTGYVFAGDDAEIRLTLPQLAEQATRACLGLQRLGIRAGDVVAVQVPNRPELVIAYYAAWLAGALVVPITHIYDATEMSFILRQSRARALIIPDRWRAIDFTDRVNRLEPLPDLDQVIFIADEPTGSGTLWSELLTLAPDAEYADPGVGADDVCCMIYTSGTTSAPKGVQHTHNTLLAEFIGNISVDQLEPDESALVAWPAGHVAGLIGICTPATRGVDVVLMDRWDPARALDLIKRHRCGTTSGTPLHFNALLDEAARRGVDVSPLHFGVAGAANVPASLVERADREGLALARVYGSTEHPTVSSSLGDDTLQHRAFTDGCARRGNEFRIVDELGGDLPTGQEGELATRGPELFVGYRDASLDLESFLPGGWYLTGDIARADADGFITITDRRKDIIIRGGENIASKEVEDVLVTHPAVAEAAVVSKPDEKYGESVAAYVRLREGTSLTLDEVRAHFTGAGLARQKTPETLIVLDDLPRTPSGKVQKFALRQQLREQVRVS
ncbi:AMP-binding protein [Nocardioides sp. Iso805N]|uniref:AMP-binding protein n=1 Tax=Nocardioides sp. Iso805N TaxID=1283287 RepID=UPI0003696D93|nr:AMP-binding protein [Nocardioides sp. Iso805N]